MNYFEDTTCYLNAQISNEGPHSAPTNAQLHWDLGESFTTDNKQHSNTTIKDTQIHWRISLISSYGDLRGPPLSEAVNL